VKIVQALGWYFPESLGGTEIYVAALAERLVAAGHRVRVAAPEPGAGAPRSYEHGGIPVFRYPIPAAPTREEVQGRRPVRGTEHLRAWLAAEAPDVVHVHTFVTGLGVAEVAAARELGARVIVTTHSSSLGFVCQRGTLMRWGTEICDGVRQVGKCAACELRHRGLPRGPAGALGAVLGTLAPGLGRVLRKLPGRLGTALGMGELIAHNALDEARLARAVDRFVVLTEAARGILLANHFPETKLAVNRLGHAHRQLEPKPGPDRRPTELPLRVGYLGRFEAIKGAEDLARAVATLPSEVPLVSEFRGPPGGAEEGGVRRRIEDLAGADSRLRLGPAVPTGEVPALLAGWDLLLCPSRCAEGGPTVAIEAHGVGTPVVGSALGGLAELIRDGVDGRLVPPGDVPALAAVLRQAAADPAGTVDRWRAALPPARTMDEVTAEYLGLYAGKSSEGGR